LDALKNLHWTREVTYSAKAVEPIQTSISEIGHSCGSCRIGENNYFELQTKGPSSTHRVTWDEQGYFVWGFVPKGTIPDMDADTKFVSIPEDDETDMIISWRDA
jgi:hypothetical protein